nr:component of SufBCD complex [uncultured Ruegeria sp.]
MDLYSSITEVIDLRSFSNLWFWIALAVMWSSVSHWVLGVPYDLIVRARRSGGQAETDLMDIVRINTNRMLYIMDMSGAILFAISCFVLTGLAISGFYYGVEFAQAVFLLMFPMSIVVMLYVATARRLQQIPKPDLVIRTLMRCRLYTQLIGMFSILVTAFWGMYQNFSLGPLG